LLKATSILGLSVGGVGITVELVLLAQGVFSVGAVATLELISLFSMLLIFPFLSALSLLFVSVRDEQRNILGFLCLIGSIAALPVAYFFLFFFYCSAIHSTCS